MMPCGWEGNRRSGVALSLWLCVTGFSDLSTYTRSYGLRKGDEHPIYTPGGVRHNLPYSVYLTVSHARTIVRECCKGDDESLWERGKFNPPPLPPQKNPFPMVTKICVGNYVGDIYHRAKFYPNYCTKT